MHIKYRILSLTVIVPTLFLAACGSADDENSLIGGFNKGFNESWNTEFVESCVAEAVKMGAPEEQTRPPCECIAGELDDQLDGITEKMNPPEDKMKAALKACNIEY